MVTAGCPFAANIGAIWTNEILRKFERGRFLRIGDIFFWKLDCFELAAGVLRMRRQLAWIVGVAIALTLTGGERIVDQKHDAIKVNKNITVPNKLDLRAVKEEVVTYRGHKAARITDDASGANDDTSRMAIVRDISMQDGTVQ